MEKSDLTPLFKPQSIAIVGASAGEGKAGYMAVKLLQTYSGKIFPVNPKEQEILGHRVYPSLSAIGAAVDLVLFAVPAPACPALLREAAQIGARAAIIMGGGFGESGASGAKIQEELVAICKETGIRMLGPNTGGYADPINRVVASFSISYAMLQPGPVAVISQSGGISLILACMLENDACGVSLTVGLGNSVDVEAADVIDYLATDHNTRAIALYLEGLKDGRRLFEAIKRTTKHKPVVALTIGRNEIADFARSHTGNLVGSYALKVAAFKQAGAVVVENSNDLVDAASALSLIRLTPAPRPGVGLLIGQAGAGLLMLDQLKSLDVNVPELSAAGIARIAEQLPPMHYLRNPVDAGRPTPEFKEVLKIMDSEECLDAILIYVLHEPTALDPVAVFKELKPMNNPVIFGTAGVTGDIRDLWPQLKEQGVMPFKSPERAARAMRALVEDAELQYRKTRYQKGSAKPLKVKLHSGPMDEARAKQVLQQIGIPVPAFAECEDHASARRAFAEMNKPVIAKVLNAAILHKTEVGGVHMNIRHVDQLTDALNHIDGIKQRGKHRYLIEEMAGPGLDLIIGGLRDPVFGPTVLLGMGGTLAEAVKDVSMRLAPLDQADAEEMLMELKTRVLLDGWRGSAPVDRQALINVLLAVSRLLIDQPAIKELDINPLRSGADGILALDALIVLSWD